MDMYVVTIHKQIGKSTLSNAAEVATNINKIIHRNIGSLEDGRNGLTS